MHPKQIGLAVGLAASMANPAHASIGQGAGLLCKFFCQGIGDLIVEIFGKRDIDPAFFGNGSIMRRDPPPGVPQHEFDRCYDQMNGVSVVASSPGNGQIRFSGVPPACMNLATVLVGDPVNGPYALPCGSDCLQYSDMTEEQFNELSEKLRAAAE